LGKDGKSLSVTTDKIPLITKLLALGAEDTEEGRTAAHKAARLIREVGAVVTLPFNQGSENSVVDQDLLKSVLPVIEEAGITVLGEGITVSIEAMIRGYEQASGGIKINPITRERLGSRLGARFRKHKKEGWVYSVIGRKGGYTLGFGVTVENGSFVRI
jgi:hypothetical protein